MVLDKNSHIYIMICLFLIYVYGCSGRKYAYVPLCVPGAHDSQKWASYYLELELKMAVSTMWVLWMNSGPLEEQLELLTTETSLQPLQHYLKSP